jgi:hypothetical protein
VRVRGAMAAEGGQATHGLRPTQKYRPPSAGSA